MLSIHFFCQVQDSLVVSVLNCKPRGQGSNLFWGQIFSKFLFHLRLVLLSLSDDADG